ncbi:MAG TPA: hypothetical protein VFW00_11820 [Rhodocyclaceae bacterium]|nr:hypothetical protein [Rhodocyclaceae bacterium]
MKTPMKMSRGVPPEIALDFISRRKRPSMLGWLILLAGILASMAVLMEYFDLQDAQTDAERRLAREERVVNRKLGHELAKTREKVPDNELRRAAQIAQELRRPWLDTLAQIETASNKDVALLTFEPDPNKGALRLGGEARSLDAVFAYAKRLSAQPSLADAQVDGYEFKKSGVVDVVVFKLTVHWKAQI